MAHDRADLLFLHAVHSRRLLPRQRHVRNPELESGDVHASVWHGASCGVAIHCVQHSFPQTCNHDDRSFLPRHSGVLAAPRHRHAQHHRRAQGRRRARGRRILRRPFRDRARPRFSGTPTAAPIAAAARTRRTRSANLRSASTATWGAQTTPGPARGSGSSSRAILPPGRQPSRRTTTRSRARAGPSAAARRSPSTHGGACSRASACPRPRWDVVGDGSTPCPRLMRPRRRRETESTPS